MAKKTKTSAGSSTSTKKTTAKKTAAKATTPNDIDPASVALIPETLVDQIHDEVGNLFNKWEIATENNLTLLQRRRKTGPGVSNYGFADKVSDLALVNPEYAHFINVNDLKRAIRNVEVCRDLFALLQSFSRAVSNTMLVYSTEAFRLALDYYDQVKLRANRGDPTAIELYRILRTRFHGGRRRASAEPTVKEVERDVHEILTHKKDGEVIVRGKTPKVLAGKTEVIDDVHTGKAKFKETEEAQEDN